MCRKWFRGRLNTAELRVVRYPFERMVSMLPLLVVLTGPSAAGKSTLLAILRSQPQKYSTHIQGTNRAERPEEDPDVECLPAVSPTKYDFIYRSAGYEYGIQRVQIEHARMRGTHHVVICNDLDTIIKLRSMYGHRVLNVFLDCDLGETEWRNRQRQREHGQVDIDRRWQEALALRELNRTHLASFDGVILNSFRVAREAMLPQLEEIMAAHHP
jgi:guanylate kinase